MKNTIIVGIALLLLCLAVPSAYSGNCTETYQTYLDKKINCYHNHSERYANSRSINLQRYASICQQKASYYTNVKNSIMEDLNKRKNCLKPHQIDVYLNERFFGTAKTNSLTAK